MDELPGNPWILNKSELIREKKEKLNCNHFFNGINQKNVLKIYLRNMMYGN